MKTSGKAFWLVKQEPESYSWDAFAKDGSTTWTGVRNFQARNNLRAMKKGDFIFYYHSVTGKEIVGMAKVAKEHYPDSTAKEGDWSVVDLVPFKKLKQPISLDQIKADATLQNMALVKNSRLSVSPVKENEAARILELSSTKI